MGGGSGWDMVRGWKAGWRPEDRRYANRQRRIRRVKKKHREWGAWYLMGVGRDCHVGALTLEDFDGMAPPV
jgi:hypothetical protein